MSLLNQLAPNALRAAILRLASKAKLPTTFVEGRNLLFLSFAAVLAKGIGAKHLLQAYVRRISAVIPIAGTVH